jgi:hypothetical protein
MRAIFVVVGNVFGEQAFQVSFIEGDDVIQQFPAAAAHPTFRDAVLPWTCEGGPDRIRI